MGTEILELGYLFQKAFWRRGYVTKAAIACKEYAFCALQARRVCSVIRAMHLSSQRVALRNGKQHVDTAIKNFRQVDMRFFLYSVSSPDAAE